MPVTIEQMIVEGSCTAEWAMRSGYRWGTLVIGGDALRKRQAWLKARASSLTENTESWRSVA